MRDAVRAALGACLLIAASGCATKGEVEALRARFKEMNAPPLPLGERIQRVKEDEARLEKRVTEEQPRENGALSAKGEAVLKVALTDADARARPDAGPAPGPSKLNSFKCYQTICKGITFHPTDEAYRAFVAMAFGGGPKQLHTWFSVAKVDGEDAGTARTATFYTGVPKESSRPPVPGQEKGKPR